MGVSAVALAPAATANAVVADETAQAVDPIIELTQKHARAARMHARLHPTRTRAEVRDWSLRHLRKANRKLKRQARAAQAPSVAVPGHLSAIAACESGGNPSAVDPSGTYRGKYQFDLQTWQSVGGSGDPAAAPEAEQDKRAAILYSRSGATPWPVCGS